MSALILVWLGKWLVRILLTIGMLFKVRIFELYDSDVVYPDLFKSHYSTPEPCKIGKDSQLLCVITDGNIQIFVNRNIKYL